MTHFILGVFILTGQFFDINPKTTSMGMEYYIYPNKQTNCENNFGNGLTFFFEQVGGYGETAEVEQVGKILNIDLAVFQDVEYDPDDKEQLEVHWKDIDSFTMLVDTFISKIKSYPDYYKKVVHNPNKQKQDMEYSRIRQIEDTAKANRLYEELQNQPFYFYPPDYEYLSKGGLLKDLQTLKMTLGCYKKSGVTKIRLEYT